MINHKERAHGINGAAGGRDTSQVRGEPIELLVYDFNGTGGGANHNMALTFSTAFDVTAKLKWSLRDISEVPHRVAPHRTAHYEAE